MASIYSVLPRTSLCAPNVITIRYTYLCMHDKTYSIYFYFCIGVEMNVYYKRHGVAVDK